MTEIPPFLIEHGYAILFGVVFLEQTGLPVASVPVLLGIGALSVEGRFSIVVALLLAVLASLLADVIWYELGRRRGFGVLRVLCRISMEPDTCVKRTTTAFRRHGSGTLVAAKFIPGFGAVATPMAHIYGDRSEIIRRHGMGSRRPHHIPQSVPRIIIPDSEHHIMVDQPLALVAAMRALLAVWPA